MALRDDVIDAITDTWEGISDGTQVIGGDYLADRLRVRGAVVEATFPNHLTDPDEAEDYLEAMQNALGASIAELFEENSFQEAFAGGIADGIIYAITAPTPGSGVAEAIDDRVAALMQNTPTITWTYADGLNQLSAGVIMSGLDHGSIGGLGDDDHTMYHTDGRALTWLGTRSTDDLPEGVTNLYFTNARAISAVGGVTGLANPTASLGLTAINGSATTAMRSDAAPALNQAIAPVWTGTHTHGDGTANPSIRMNGLQSAVHDIIFMVGGLNRWVIRRGNQTESGSNVGSDFQLNARADDGTDLGAAITIRREAGGLMTIARDVSITDATASSSIITGSLINAGGFGNSGAAYFGSTGNFAGALDVTGIVTGAAGFRPSIGGGGTRLLYSASDHGLTIRGGAGSINDFSLISVAGNYLMQNPTGTNNLTVGYASATTTIPGAATISGTLTGAAANWSGNQTISAAYLSLSGVGAELRLANTNSSLTSLTHPFIGATTNSGGALPFLEAGNLILVPRTSGATRSIYFYGGDAAIAGRVFTAGTLDWGKNFNIYADNTFASAKFTVAAASGNTFIAGTLGLNASPNRTGYQFHGTGSAYFENSGAAFDLNYTSTGQDTIFIRNTQAVAGLDVVHASIGFGRIDGSNQYRGAAIAAIQTSADADQTGLNFYVQSGAPSASNIVRAMQIKHDKAITMDGTATVAGVFTASSTSTFTGGATFNAIGTGTSSAVQLVSTTPGLRFSDTDAGSNEKEWGIVATGTTLLHRTRTDAHGSGTEYWTITRSGVNVAFQDWKGLVANGDVQYIYDNAQPASGGAVSETLTHFAQFGGITAGWIRWSKKEDFTSAANRTAGWTLVVRKDGNDYEWFNIDANAATMAIGNTGSNPAFNFLGTGTVTHGGSVLASATAGSHAFASALPTTTWFYVAPTSFTPGASGGNIGRFDGTINAFAGGEAGIFRTAGTIVEAGSGTHGLLWGARFVNPTVTGAAGLVTKTATVYIDDAMSATVTDTNYALYSNAGANYFGGSLKYNAAIFAGSGGRTTGAAGGTSGSPTNISVTGKNRVVLTPTADGQYYNLTNPTDGQIVYINNTTNYYALFSDGAGGILFVINAGGLDVAGYNAPGNIIVLYDSTLGTWRKMSGTGTNL